MKAFKYTARNSRGDVIEGVAEANTRDEAIASLRNEGLIVISMDEPRVTDIDLKLGGRKAKEKALSVVCNQFAILLQAGLPITRTLELIANQCEDKTIKQMLSDCIDDVAAGFGLAASMEKHGEGLPTTFIESIRAGEDSGQLETVFTRLSKYYEKSSKTKSAVKGALIYPALVIGVAVVVVAIIMIFAVPVFKDTFASMGQDLPWVTQFVIDCSDFWTSYWWLVGMVIVGAYLGVQIGMRRSESFHLRMSQLAVDIPVIGKITHMGAGSEYAGTMSVMMAAGLPIVRAVGVTARSMNNYYLGQSLAKTLPDLEAGRTLAGSLEAQNTLPRLAIEMTAVGEQTGALEHTLDVVAEYYDNEVESATATAISLLEPAIIIVLAVMVMILLLAVYLPMFSMYGDIS